MPKKQKKAAKQVVAEEQVEPVVTEVVAVTPDAPSWFDKGLWATLSEEQKISVVTTGKW